MRHYIYRIEEDRDHVGMISIPDESLMSRVPPDSVEVGETPVPEDKSGQFFEAWRLGGDGKVTVDLEHAKKIRLDWLRKRRERIFKSLDRKQFQAYCSDRKKDVEAIEAEKELLRHFPEHIDWDVVKDVGQIGHVIPPELT